MDKKVLAKIDPMTWNGHTHTEFCPHGSKEDTEIFVKKAIKLGFKTYSITEHFPMPPEFASKASGDLMAINKAAFNYSVLPKYFSKVNYLKEKYKDQISILVGFEFDFIYEFREWTAEQLFKYHKDIDDAILSIHFLPTSKGLREVDYSYSDYVDGVLKEYKTFQGVMDAYLETLLKAIKWSPQYKPSRYGHISLYRRWVREFSKKDVIINPKTGKLISNIINLISQEGSMLDFNTSGLNKPSQLETSPNFSILQDAKNVGIPLIFGSDAHDTNNLSTGHDIYKNFITK
ncbi:MAG: histidinol-phosphatase HisJ [Oenococcus oeni]